jgi:3-isopropylmalate/(R)-2-methylmalate dehydratase small subunit
MRAVRRVVGHALPIDRANVDTDQIIPAHWLKRVERTGYGAGLFEAWRRDPAFVMNDPRYAGASILIAGANFGSGSSREHAVWALDEAGFRAVIAPRLADIFRANCLKSGVVPVEIDADAAATLIRLVEGDPRVEITVDVERRMVEAPGVRATFALEDHAQARLLEGLDDIAVTLSHAEEITTYEASRATWLPSLRD